MFTFIVNASFLSKLPTPEIVVLKLRAYRSHLFLILFIISEPVISFYCRGMSTLTVSVALLTVSFVIVKNCIT